jgi:hypothetical protein
MSDIRTATERTLTALTGRIASVGWVSAVLEVRVQDKAIASNAKVIVVRAFSSPEDPTATVYDLHEPLASLDILSATACDSSLLMTRIQETQLGDESFGSRRAICDSVAVLLETAAHDHDNIKIGVDLIGRSA